MRTSRSKRKRVLMRTRQLGELMNDAGAARKLQAAWIRSWRAQIRRRAVELDGAGVVELLRTNTQNLNRSSRDRLTRWAWHQLESARRQHLESSLRAVERLLARTDYEGVAAFAEGALQKFGGARIEERLLQILPMHIRRAAQNREAWEVVESVRRCLPTYADAVADEAKAAVQRVMQERLRKCEC